MLRSMTGFGQASVALPGYRLQIDIKSVNHRYCEIVIRMPREWMLYEDGLKKHIQQQVKRGRVDAFITIERDAETGRNVEVRWPLVEAYRTAAAQIRERLDLPEQFSLSLRDYVSLPDVIMMSDQVVDREPMEQALNRCLTEALNQLTAMREAEGRQLQTDLAGRLNALAAMCEQAAIAAPAAVEDYRHKLRQRIRELLDDAGFDEQRFLMEVAVMAERANIDEELTRLKSHAVQFKSLMSVTDPVGRKLDFLIQEMNREINTIGSKANFGFLVNLVVEMKAELEKMREQVQNIE